MTISSDTVRSRLYYWNNHLPPNGYSQTTYSRGADGNSYRNDCSGYVSMLLGLTGSPNTGMLVLPMFTMPLVSKDELRFGDLIIAVAGGGHSSGHVVMFDSWANSARSSYHGHDFGYGDQPHHTVHVYPYEPDGRVFRPYRPLVLSGSLPDPDVRGSYTVRSGDTLSEIGRRVGVDWHEIAALNGIPSPYVIVPGQVLKLTAGVTSGGGSSVPVPNKSKPKAKPGVHVKGVSVEEAQRALNAHGAHLTVDNIWGPKTAAATNDAKRKRSLPADSVFGSRLWRAIKPRPKPGLHVKGVSLRQAQRALNAHGAHLVVDGIWGPHTQAATNAAKKDRHLPQDGVFGGRLWRAVKP